MGRAIVLGVLAAGLLGTACTSDDNKSGGGGSAGTSAGGSVNGGAPNGGVSSGGASNGGGGTANGGAPNGGSGGVSACARDSGGGLGGSGGAGQVCADTGSAGNGKSCTDYCTSWFDLCGGLDATYTDLADCVSKCDQFTQSQLCCRLTHLGFAKGYACSTADRATHCQHSIGQGQCQ